MFTQSPLRFAKPTVVFHAFSSSMLSLANTWSLCHSISMFMIYKTRSTNINTGYFIIINMDIINGGSSVSDILKVNVM